MAPWLETFDDLGPLLVRASWQAAVVAAVVFLVCMTLRDRLAPRWRFALWALVLVRLVLPVLPASPASLFRIIGWQPTASRVLEFAAPTGPTQVDGNADSSLPATDLQIASAARSSAPTKSDSPPNATSSESPASIVLPQQPAIRWTAWKAAGLVWVGGILLLAGRLALQIYSLHRRQRSWRTVDEPETLSVLNHCRRLVGVQARIELCTGPHESSPAVTGVWRPRIVIPENLLSTLTREQLELVLLHELAHIRRRDIPVQWLLIAVRLAYWFNPVAWLVVSRMQAERELACDELVLDAVGAPRSRSYGDTLLEIVKGSAQPLLTPGLLGAISTFGRLHRRIAMIRDYRKRSWRGTLAAVAVLASVAAIGLTDSPRTTRGEEKEVSKQKEPKAVGDKPAADTKKSEDSRPVRCLISSRPRRDVPFAKFKTKCSAQFVTWQSSAPTRFRN